MLALAAACSHAPSREQQWFAARGRESATWYGCLRMGAALRAECGSNLACTAAVTDVMIRPCYASRYHATSSLAPHGPLRPEQLSPCFWDEAPTHPATPLAYAQTTCTSVVEERLLTSCIAELREVIEGACKAGALDLTVPGRECPSARAHPGSPLRDHAKSA